MECSRWPLSYQMATSWWRDRTGCDGCGLPVVRASKQSQYIGKGSLWFGKPRRRISRVSQLLCIRGGRASNTCLLGLYRRNRSRGTRVGWPASRSGGTGVKVTSRTAKQRRENGKQGNRPRHRATRRCGLRSRSRDTLSRPRDGRHGTPEACLWSRFARRSSLRPPLCLRRRPRCR